MPIHRSPSPEHDTATILDRTGFSHSLSSTNLHSLKTSLPNSVIHQHIPIRNTSSPISTISSIPSSSASSPSSSPRTSPASPTDFSSITSSPSLNEYAAHPAFHSSSSGLHLMGLDAAVESGLQKQHQPEEQQHSQNHVQHATIHPAVHPSIHPVRPTLVREESAATKRLRSLLMMRRKRVFAGWTDAIHAEYQVAGEKGVSIWEPREPLAMGSAMPHMTGIFEVISSGIWV